MKKYVLFLSASLCLFTHCTKDNDTKNINKILMLKVDFLTNTFEGGTETTYTASPATFTLSNQYKSPGDFGNVKIKYQELDKIVFDGDIVWAGKGEINYPQDILPADRFASVAATDIVVPFAGFENVFNPYRYTFDYTPVWLAVQRLVKVREYLSANPNASIKLFLYTPSVGAGDPADYDWIIFLKN